MGGVQEPAHTPSLINSAVSQCVDIYIPSALCPTDTPHTHTPTNGCYQPPVTVYTGLFLWWRHGAVSVDVHGSNRGWQPVTGALHNTAGTGLSRDTVGNRGQVLVSK